MSEPVSRPPPELPPRPEPPAPGDCCGGGCARCVIDQYALDLEAWQRQVDALLAQHAHDAAHPHP